MGSKNVAVERMLFYRIWGDIRGGQNLSQRLTLLACKCLIKSRLLQRNDSDGQDPLMDRRRKMGGFKIGNVHVDLYQDGAYRVAEAHSRHAGVLEAEDVLYYAVRELGLCRNFRRPRVGIRKHTWRARRRRCDGQGFG